MGYPLKKATRERIKLFPEYEKLILAYYGRWEEMLSGEISGTVKILNTIYQKEKFKLLGLTNWSSETFPVALKRFKFLRLFTCIFDIFLSNAFLINIEGRSFFKTVKNVIKIIKIKIKFRIWRPLIRSHKV